MSLEVFLPLQFFERVLEGWLGISSSLNVGYNSPVKPSGPGLLFFGRFLITALISVLVVGMFINFYFFLVQSWKIELFKESVHFLQVIHFIAI